MPIFDQGYQHWSGTLGGHAWRWLPITRQGVRAGLKSRVIRTFLLLSWGPALALVFVVCVWGMLERKSEFVAPIVQLLTFIDPDILSNPRKYRLDVWTICFDFFLLTELRFSMLLILLVGPNLISQDLRFNALPLYFSRPLRRIDYFLGKLGVIAVFIGLMVIAPALLAYILGLLFSLDWTIVRDTFPLLLSSLTYGVIVTLSAGLLVLALSSLSRNSRYVVLFWLGIWFVTSILASVLHEVDRDQRRHAYYNRPMPAMNRDWSKMTPGERIRAQREMNDFHSRARAEYEAAEVRSATSDWRPVVSYTANLSRVGQQLLGTNASWEKFAQLLPATKRDRFLYDYMGPQYPWYWSAAVLVGLFGLSACILNFRVKSLDRLK
jgi:ABC-2 type transport system permease protein